jgi:hypothetical protein
MKKIKLIILLLLVCSSSAFAQRDTSQHFPAIEAGWGDLNYAVPESPGFKILGTSPSSIMRPTSVRDIAFSVGNYFVSNGGTIPQNLAVEISPKLFKPDVSLTDFNNKRFWYTSALSVGTKVNADKSYAIGVGLKFRIFDFQDLRSNSTLLNKLDPLGRASVDAHAEALRSVALKHAKADPSENSYEFWLKKVDSIYHVVTPSTTYGQAIKAEVADYIRDVGKFNANRISEVRDSIKKISWNKTIWDIGIASLFNSKDSLLRNIKPASKLGLWTTAGFPLFKNNKGQLLIGITGQLRDTVNSRLGVKSLNIGSRAYYGSNDVKGFVEANSLWQTGQKFTYKASLGIETTFFGGMWVDFSLGLSKQGGAKAVFTPGFNLFFGTGEKKPASTRM